MARSLKKKPYVFGRLLTKVEKLNESGKKEKLSNQKILTIECYGIKNQDAFL